MRNTLVRKCNPLTYHTKFIVVLKFYSCDKKSNSAQVMQPNHSDTKNLVSKLVSSLELRRLCGHSSLTTVLRQRDKRYWNLHSCGLYAGCSSHKTARNMNIASKSKYILHICVCYVEHAMIKM